LSKLLSPQGTGTPLSSQLIRVPVPKSTPQQKPNPKSTNHFPRVPVPNLSFQLILVPVPRTTNQKTKNPTLKPSSPGTGTQLIFSTH